MEDEVVVERDGDVLVVSWSSVVDELRVGVSADVPGDLVEVDGGGRVELVGLDPSVRHYVHARVGERWVVAAERLVPLEGAHNFRDLGGYPTVDDRTVRWGRVFRSDGLGRLTERDLGVLEALGVRAVCDLRSDEEHVAAPSVLPPSAARLSCAVAPARPGQPTLDDRIVAGDLERLDVDDVVDLYLLMLDQYAPRFGAVFGHLAEVSPDPVLFHCAAGKDRTGIVAALLLSLLGVPDDHVVADYLLTERYRTARRLDEIRAWLAEHGRELEPFAALYVPQRETIARTLEAVRDEHGGVEAFLVGPGEVDAGVPDQLRRDLLVG